MAGPARLTERCCKLASRYRHYIQISEGWGWSYTKSLSRLPKWEHIVASSVFFHSAVARSLERNWPAQYLKWGRQILQPADYDHIHFTSGKQWPHDSSPSDRMNQTLNDSEKLEVPGIETAGIHHTEAAVSALSKWFTNNCFNCWTVKKIALGFPVIDTTGQAQDQFFRADFVPSIDGYLNHQLG